MRTMSNQCLKENPETHPPPELQEFDVMVALSKIKKTATGPDGFTVLGLEGQLHNPSSCGDCSVEQVSVLLHMANSLERS